VAVKDGKYERSSPLVIPLLDVDLGLNQNSGTLEVALLAGQMEGRELVSHAGSLLKKVRRGEEGVTEGIRVGGGKLQKRVGKDLEILGGEGKKKKRELRREQTKAGGPDGERREEGGNEGKESKEKPTLFASLEIRYSRISVWPP
jgi:hypothetical protein